MFLQRGRVGRETETLPIPWWSSATVSPDISYIVSHRNGCNSGEERGVCRKREVDVRAGCYFDASILLGESKSTRKRCPTDSGETVCARAYHVLCKKLSTAATTPLRSLKNYRPRTANALRKRYLIIALECGRFVEADVRASHIEKKSGHTLQMFRDSAHNFYNEKHK